jgi:hypothetical protein
VKGICRAGLLVVGLLAIGCSRSATTSGTPNEDKSVLSVTSEQLAREFQADEKGAAAKYKGRTVEIEGPLIQYVAAGNELGLGVLAGLDMEPGGLKSWHSMCTLTPEAARKAATLTPTQKVKIRGLFHGHVGMTLHFVNCELLEIGKDPAIPVSARELCQVYAKDPKAGDTLFKDKAAQIEGVYVGVKSEKTGDALFEAMVLEGGKTEGGEPLEVWIAMTQELQPGVAKLKDGQGVRVRGMVNAFKDGRVYVIFARFAD